MDSAFDPGRLAPVSLIATDIDGTMLRSDGQLSPRVRRALHDARDAGLWVVPATGRPVVVADQIIRDLAIEDFWVFANGAVTKHVGRDEVIRAYWMAPDLVETLVSEVRDAIDGVGFAMELERHFIFEPGFLERVPRSPSGLFPVDDVLTAADFVAACAGETGYRIQKLAVFHPELDDDALFALVHDTVGSRAVPSYSGLAFIELAAGATTKALALHELCRDLGVDAAEVAAFGDNHNDVTMLQWAGQSFAMANASDDAKAAAGGVIPSSDDDGLALMVEAILHQR